MNFHGQLSPLLDGIVRRKVEACGISIRRYRRWTCILPQWTTMVPWQPVRCLQTQRFQKLFATATIDWYFPTRSSRMVDNDVKPSNRLLFRDGHVEMGEQHLRAPMCHRKLLGALPYAVPEIYSSRHDDAANNTLGGRGKRWTSLALAYRSAVLLRGTGYIRHRWRWMRRSRATTTRPNRNDGTRWSDCVAAPANIIGTSMSREWLSDATCQTFDIQLSLRLYRCATSGALSGTVTAF